jgi:hypothetical protein
MDSSIETFFSDNDSIPQPKRVITTRKNKFISFPMLAPLANPALIMHTYGIEDAAVNARYDGLDSDYGFSNLVFTGRRLL